MGFLIVDDSGISQGDIHHNITGTFFHELDHFSQVLSCHLTPFHHHLVPICPPHLILPCHPCLVSPHHLHSFPNHHHLVPSIQTSLQPPSISSCTLHPQLRQS